MPGDASSSRLGSRRSRVLLVVLGIAVVALVLLLPLVRAPFEARAATDDLVAAKEALAAGDDARAEDLVSSARGHVDTAQGGMGGLAADVASVLPVVGTSVDDGRLLVQALDDATAVGEIGVDLYASAAGDDATLFRDEQVDEDTLRDVVSGAQAAAQHLASAEAALDQVEGTTPVVGGTIAAKRDEAAAVVDPMADTLTDLSPMLDRLPRVFGFEGKRSYLLAMMNPAELRYSGGAALAFAPVTFDAGKLELGASVQTASDPSLLTPVTWQPVRGNRFHKPHPVRPTSATFAPSWSVSGEELLRAWKVTRGARHDGVIAVDVVALAHLLGVTGGVTIPGYGELTADNLAQTVIGSYDQYYPDPTVRNTLNAQLIPAFQSQLFDGGGYVDKARALAEAADQRHFALYFRDRDTQEGVSEVGLDGDLAEPVGDYVGAFTQNTNGSKVDYYQRRDLTLDVDLSADGSAANRLAVDVHNDSPPYAVPGVDPKSWYFTRWAGLSLGVFVPRDAELEDATLLGQPSDVELRKYYRQAFAAQPMMLAQGATGRFSMRYQVPDAATVDESGELTYRLAYDPQGMVTSQTGSVRVRLPSGYVATAVPEGWTVDGDTVVLPPQELGASAEWEIVASPRQ